MLWQVGRAGAELSWPEKEGAEASDGGCTECPLRACGGGGPQASFWEVLTWGCFILPLGGRFPKRRDGGLQVGFLPELGR